MKYYNIHTHVFNMRNAPEKFLNMYLPDPLANFINRASNTDFGARTLGRLLNLLGGNFGRRHASFLRIGKSKQQKTVFENLVKQYDDDVVFVGLTLNMDHCGAGSCEVPLDGQIQEVLDIKKKYPDKLMLFLGVDPRWDGPAGILKDSVQKYFETKLDINETGSVYPFCGIKIYPSTGFYCFDPRLADTLDWAADNDIPVLSHCSYLGGIFNNNENYIRSSLNLTDPATGKPWPAHYIKENNLGRYLLGRQKASNNLKSCSYFMEPVTYASLFDRHQAEGRKPLKLCLAHFGGGNQMKDRDRSGKVYGIKNKNWFSQIQEMMDKYPSLYTDISYALHDDTLFKLIFDEMNNPKYGNRIMFGTDYFMTEREKPEKSTYSTFRKAASAHPLTNFNNENAWERSAGSNILEFLKSKYF